MKIICKSCGGIFTAADTKYSYKQLKYCQTCLEIRKNEWVYGKSSEKSRKKCPPEYYVEKDEAYEDYFGYDGIDIW
jgi:hypothetical protein